MPKLCIQIPEDVRVPQQMDIPDGVPSYRVFLGLISYYTIFLQNPQHARDPPNKLLQKEQTWCWLRQWP